MSGMMEKFVLLPFSLGCLPHSQSSTSQPKREGKEGKKEKTLRAGLLNLLKSFKGSLDSQLFSGKMETDEEDGDDMEIGYPTDVKHVGHIGWDGFSKPNTLQNTMKDWNKRQSARASVSHDPFN